MVTMDAEADQEVSRRDLVKGYEFEKDRYVLLDEEDFASAKIETSSTMTVDKFVGREAIQPIYFDTSYYMVPDGEAGQDVYVVLRDAIAASGMAALSRVVISRRERAVAILPLENGMVLHTLHEPRDLYALSQIVRSRSRWRAGCGDGEARAAADRASGRASSSRPILEDRYEARLREVIDAKLKGEGITAGRTRGGTARRQCHRPDGGAEAKPGPAGWRGARSIGRCIAAAPQAPTVAEVES